jgi:hypothetical protein
MVEPLPEADAARRVYERQQTAQGSDASMSTTNSESSSISNTYAPRDNPIIDTVTVENESHAVLGCLAQDSSSVSKLPGPARTSSERAHSPTVLAFGDQAPTNPTVSPKQSSATRVIQRLPMMQRPARALSARRAQNQTPKPRSRLQAARRAAPAPIQEEPRAPSYRSSWLKRDKRLTREAYEGVDSLERIDTLSMLEELC